MDLRGPLYDNLLFMMRDALKRRSPFTNGEFSLILIEFIILKNYVDEWNIYW